MINEVSDPNRKWDVGGKMCADLFSRCGAQVLVPLQQTFAEVGLIRSRFHSGEGHLTLVEDNRLC